jgi:hypothetical protein
VTCIVYLQQMGTGVPQQTTMLNWANLSERAQKIKGLNFCASQFVTEDEVKYCVAKLFSGDVKFATMVCAPLPSLTRVCTDWATLSLLRRPFVCVCVAMRRAWVGWGGEAIYGGSKRGRGAQHWT